MDKFAVKIVLLLFPLLASLSAIGQTENAFQSTSSMMGSGSAYSSNPTLGSNGMATQPMDALSSSGRGRGRTLVNDEEYPDEDVENPDGDDDDNPNPIGEPLVMLFFAAAAAAVVALRRRRAQA